MGFLSRLLMKFMLNVMVLLIVAVVLLGALKDSGIFDQVNTANESFQSMGVDVKVTDFIFHPQESLDKLINEPFKRLSEF